MAESNVTLDHKGLAEVLKSAEVHALMNDIAHQVAEAAAEAVNGASPVPVHEYTTDRGAASVSIRAKYQVTDGVLTRAATGLGLEVRDRA
jgi:flagellar hook-basal body complex protein FliE